MTDGPTWYVDVMQALLETKPADVTAALPGLVDVVAGADEDVDHYVVGVSFSRQYTPLDYAVDRIREPGDDPEPVVEPASERHAYVHFSHPRDPQFDGSSLRARLLGALERERRAARNPDGSSSRLADLWEDL